MFDYLQIIVSTNTYMFCIIIQVCMSYSTQMKIPAANVKNNFNLLILLMIGNFWNFYEYERFQ